MNNQTNYLANKKKLQAGDFVYANSFPDSAFSKSYDVQRGEIFIVDYVSAEVSPPLYFLKDLAKHKLENKSFYRSQLIKTKDPENKYFDIEKKLGSRTNSKGVKEIFVKFLYYPNKFNKWVEESQVKRGKKKKKKKKTSKK